MLELYLFDYQVPSLADKWLQVEGRIDDQLHPGMYKTRVVRITDIGLAQGATEWHVAYEVGLASEPGVVRQQIKAQLGMELISRGLVGTRPSDITMFFLFDTTCVFEVAIVHETSRQSA